MISLYNLFYTIIQRCLSKIKSDHIYTSLVQNPLLISTMLRMKFIHLITVYRVFNDIDPDYLFNFIFCHFFPDLLLSILLSFFGYFGKTKLFSTILHLLLLLLGIPLLLKGFTLISFKFLL